MEYLIRLDNRVMIHHCKKGSCLTEKFKTVKDSDGNKKTVTERHCRFNFPFPLNGFKPQINEETGELEGIEPDLKEENDVLSDALQYGASYRRLDEACLLYTSPSPRD